MSKMGDKDINPYLFNLIVSHEAAAMQFLGKIAGPEGKVERDLDMARFAIDTLETLREKTTGNLTDAERQLLDHVLYQLHLNYVDEVEADKKAAPPEGGTPADLPSGSQTPSTPEQNQ